MRQLFRELKRRNVYKVAVTYAVVAFVTLQAAKLVFPATTLEGLYDKLVVLAFVGFPIALVLAWAFELTPEGMRRTPAEEDGSEAPSRREKSRLAVTALVGLGLVGAVVAGGWYLMGGGGEPSAETAATADRASTEPRAEDRSIAVLPFDALGQREPGTFTEGMHDDLLTRLSNISGLTVISRTAVQQFRDTELTTRHIADSLGVRWVMEGGVQEMGDQIQVNAQLIDPRTEGHAWAESYRRDLTAEDLFALQSEITKKIARSLEAELSPEEAERIERQPTGDLEAYRLYVQGRSALNTRTSEGLRQAVESFRRAIRQDSSYALAWSGLADAVALYPQYGPDSVPDDLPDHEPAARRALELDPELAEAHASMGFVEFYAQDGPAALRHLERAVELKPSYAQAHHWLGYTYYYLGRLDAAREHLSLAIELNPRHAAAQGMMGLVLLAEGAAAKAESHLQRVPESGSFHQSLVLYHMQRWDELERLARERLSEEGEPGWRFDLARIAVLRGDTASAREHLAEVGKEEAPLIEGLIHAALGDLDAAFTSWQEIEEWSPGEMAVLRYWFPDVLHPLRDDPRFQALIREANQAWGLNPDGSLPDSVEVALDSEAEPDG